MLATRNGVEEIVPGLSTWTAEDLLVAGAWDEELAGFVDMDPDEEPNDEDLLEEAPY